MSTQSYVVPNRNIENGDYIEEEVVKFQISVSDDGQINYPTNINNWQDMKSFWENDIESQDPSWYLNSLDLASQLSLPYMSVGLNNFALRHAKRSFGVSRFFDYNLSSPASRELDSNITNKKNLNMMYTNHNNIKIEDFININNIQLDDLDDKMKDVIKYLLEYKIFYPSSIGFIGINNSLNLIDLNLTALKGFNNAIPIGYIKNKNSTQENRIYLEKNEYIKYKDIFNKIYSEIYDYKQYDKVSEDRLKWSVSWCATNKNISHYYELIWQKMLDYKNKLDIKTIDDLNSRFIQYKYYAFLQASYEQQNCIYDLTNLSEMELEAKSQIEKEVKLSESEPNLYPYLCKFLNIENVENTWLMQPAPSDSPNTSFLPELTRVIDFNLLYYTAEKFKSNLEKKWKKNEITEEKYNDYLINSSYSKIMKTINIFNFTVSPYEKYLFSSLNNSNRTTQYNGAVYVVNDTWFPNLNYPILKHLFPQFANNTSLPIGQNIQYFFYETKQKISFNYFAIKWFILSFVLFFISAIAYKKYDIK